MSRTFANTSNGIHLGLAFDYHAHDAVAVGRNISYIFGGYFVDWKLGIDPRVRHIDSYIPFDLDAYPQAYRGHSLGDWKARHPGWIVYRCDRRTPAYYGSGSTNVPLDFSNPAVRAYEIREVERTFAQGASGVAFDNFTFANIESRCGVYRNDSWTSLGYPGRWQVNTKLANDMVSWLSSMRGALRRRFPTNTVAVNMDFAATPLKYVQEVAPDVDMFLDEGGFTDFGTQNITGVAWQREVNTLEYLNDQGKAFDVNGIVDAPSDKQVTPAQINWVLANYLLVKGAHSYTYIYAGDHVSQKRSPSGYGTFYNRPQYHVAIGHPTSARVGADGVQLRRYSGGLVIVNPSGLRTFSVPLGGAYRDMFGHSYTSVTLPPASGLVLLN